MTDIEKAIIEDMHLALRSELGARTIYPLLRRVTRDAELKRVLEKLYDDEVEQVRRMRGLMKELGAHPPAWSFRRTLASWAVALATPIFGMRFALRLCHDAESAVARWYGAYRDHFMERGETERGQLCDELSQTKTRHAQNLGAWVQNVPFRRLMR